MKSNENYSNKVIILKPNQIKTKENRISESANSKTVWIWGKNCTHTCTFHEPKKTSLLQ